MDTRRLRNDGNDYDVYNQIYKVPSKPTLKEI